MKISRKMTEAAAKTIRRWEYPAKIDPRPWSAISEDTKRMYLARAERVLKVAMKAS